MNKYIVEIQRCMADMKRLGELSEMLRHNPDDEAAREELDELIARYPEPEVEAA